MKVGALSNVLLQVLTWNWDDVIVSSHSSPRIYFHMVMDRLAKNGSRFTLSVTFLLMVISPPCAFVLETAVLTSLYKYILASRSLGTLFVLWIYTWGVVSWPGSIPSALDISVLLETNDAPGICVHSIVQPEPRWYTLCTSESRPCQPPSVWSWSPCIGGEIAWPGLKRNCHETERNWLCSVELFKSHFSKIASCKWGIFKNYRQRKKTNE